MSEHPLAQYECTPATFTPRARHPVRWLDWEADFGLAQAMWPEAYPLTPEIWQEAREAGYRYCAVIEDGRILSIAAVWRYSDEAWEAAAVSTRPDARRRGCAASVVSFATAHILDSGRRATCTTAADNLAMQRTAEAVGFRRIGQPAPTPYPDVNAALDALRSGAQAVLGPRLVGLYLYGSLASGDFDPDRSDIDFLAVTDGPLPEETVRQLEAMHARLAADGPAWAARLEGYYLPQADLRRYPPAGVTCPHINEGRFYLGRHGGDAVIQHYVVREWGVALAGPPPRDLIDPILPDELREAVRDILRGWWAPMLDDPSRLRSREYQAYAVLTLCRALYTLEHGTVVSKPAAARWARETLGGRWPGLIERALAWPRAPQPDELDDTLSFLHLALERGS
jgi:RimJ/RimL family protein N-acetyltransferase